MSDVSGYNVRPSTRFDTAKTKSILLAILQQEYSDREYDKAMANQWSKNTCNSILKAIKDLNLERYKFVVNVTINEQRGAGFKMQSNCYWDSDSDAVASGSFSTVSNKVSDNPNIVHQCLPNPHHVKPISSSVVSNRWRRVQSVASAKGLIRYKIKSLLHEVHETIFGQHYQTIDFLVVSGLVLMLIGFGSILIGIYVLVNDLHPHFYNFMVGTALMTMGLVLVLTRILLNFRAIMHLFGLKHDPGRSPKSALLASAGFAIAATANVRHPPNKKSQIMTISCEDTKESDLNNNESQQNGNFQRIESIESLDCGSEERPENRLIRSLIDRIVTQGMVY